MREIKFRVWDVEDGEMIEWNRLKFIWNLGETFEDDTEYYPYMQYTGLKDKNGKEIYEGDIVKGFYEEYDPYFDVVNKHEFVSDVKWVENCFAIHRNTVSSEGRIRDYGYQSEWDSETVEVIGNIYEHPHLLQEEN